MRGGGFSLNFIGFVDLFKYRALFQIQTQPDGKDHYHDAREERNTPAPGDELFAIEQEEHYRPDGRGAQRPAVGAHRYQRRDDAAFAFWRILRQHGSGAGNFSARPQSLDNTQGHQ